jgi:hypothetical protein
MFKLLTDSLFVAICRSNWLYSSKYGTVWYHPASFRFYLTVFILCQFHRKMTSTLPDFDARATCVKPANPAWREVLILRQHTQMVCTRLTDGLPGGFQAVVRRVLREFLRRFVSICFVRCFCLLRVCQMVCEESADGIFRADGPRVGHRQFFFRAVALEVWVAFSDGSP